MVVLAKSDNDWWKNHASDAQVGNEQARELVQLHIVRKKVIYSEIQKVVSVIKNRVKSPQKISSKPN